MSGALPNTLLVQRLDAVLGISLAKYAGIARSNAAFDALAEPGRTTPVSAPNPRREQATPGQTQVNTPSRPAVDTGDEGRLRQVDETARLFPSSPTSLGMAARTVLGLLQRYPETPQPLVLRQPLASHGLLQSAATDSRPAVGTWQPAVAPKTSGQTAGLTALDTNTAAIAQLAKALALRVSTSGMFYEANLARVAFEGLPARSLRAHPQSQSPANASSGMLDARHPPRALAQWMGAKESSSAPTGASLTTPPQPFTPADELLPEHATLVRQQLEVLATQQWNARAEAWPGVPMAWQIGRMSQDSEYPAADPDGHPPRSAQTDGSDAPWQSRLTLVLPKLGTVEVHLNLHAQSCSLRIDCGESHPELRQQAETLRQQFAASGLRLTDLQITRTQPAPPSFAGPDEANIDSGQRSSG